MVEGELAGAMETQKLNNGATINVTGSGGGSRDEFKWNGGFSCAISRMPSKWITAMEGRQVSGLLNDSFFLDPQLPNVQSRLATSLRIDVHCSDALSMA